MERALSLPQRTVQPVDRSRTSPVTEPSWLAARSAPRCRQYPPVLGKGGGWCKCVCVHASECAHTYTHTASHFALKQAARSSSSSPILRPLALQTSINRLQLLFWLIVLDADVWKQTRRWKLKLVFFLDDEDVQMDRGDYWLPVCAFFKRTLSSPVPDTPSWIAATPPQTCRRLVGWGLGWGRRGVGGGPWGSLLSGYWKEAAAAARGSPWQQYLIPTTMPEHHSPTPTRPPPPPPPVQIYTYIHTHTWLHTLTDRARAIGPLRRGSALNGRSGWFKIGRRCPCELQANSCVIKMLPAN